jgi:four helix bundle protein
MIMNNYRNTNKDIHKRIFTFVVQCFKDIVQKIPKKTENIPIISQISASLTSMGANDSEADAAFSRKDFVAKYTIVRKETKETSYWLCIIRDTNILSSSTINPYINECEEIKNIVSSIINNSNRH